MGTYFTVKFAGSCPLTLGQPALKCITPSMNIKALKNESPFPSSEFERISKVERKSWWFQSRNKIILWVLRRINPKVGDTFLEVGCGTGFVLSAVSKELPGLKLSATEFFGEGLEIARLRVPQCQFDQQDARQIEIESAYDLIGCFDVLEHIREDLLVLSNFRRALKDSGFLLITVPQHKWLWSSLDEYAHHVRRYRYNDLALKLRKAGFKIEFHTSFVSLLLPAMFISRMLVSKKQITTSTTGLEISWFMNLIFNLFMKIEFQLIKLGIIWPAGGSLIVLASK